MDRNIAQTLTLAVGAIAGAWMLINIFDFLSVASAGALLGSGLGGIIGVAGFAFGRDGGIAGIIIGVFLGCFIGSGMFKFGESLIYQMGRANDERMLLAALRDQMNRITGKSEPTDENQ